MESTMQPKWHCKHEQQPANRHDGLCTMNARLHSARKRYTASKNLNDSYINPQSRNIMWLLLFLFLLFEFSFFGSSYSICRVCILRPKNHFQHNELKATGAYWALGRVRKTNYMHTIFVNVCTLICMFVTTVQSLDSLSFHSFSFFRPSKKCSP